jgi:hypothetical protein
MSLKLGREYFYLPRVKLLSGEESSGISTSVAPHPNECYSQVDGLCRAVDERCDTPVGWDVKVPILDGNYE